MLSTDIKNNDLNIVVWICPMKIVNEDVLKFIFSIFEGAIFSIFNF